MARFLTILALLALAGAPEVALAQEENAAEAVAEATTENATAEATTDDASTAEETATPEEADADDEPAVESATEEQAAEPAAEEPAEEPEDEAESSEAADEEEDADTDEADDAEEEADEPPIDWAGLMERLPAFLGIMHRAAVHMPIGLWVLGAVFVVVGVVVPSWRNQIPLACLIGGALCALPAAVSGWCLGVDYDGDWAFKDILDSDRMSESIVKHRWMAVALVISSTVFSVIALVNQRKKSAGLGFVWRVGLLALAAAVAWEGHLGGMVSLADDWFFETAVNDLLGYEFFTIE